MWKIYKYYHYQKNKEHLKKILIEKYGKKKGLKKLRTILKFYREKKKVEM